MASIRSRWQASWGMLIRRCCPRFMPRCTRTPYTWRRRRDGRRVARPDREDSGALIRRLTMRFKELLRFRRENGGDVPFKILRELQLPMPDDALEQFVADHGTNEDFQVQYGDLDLHTISWNRL